jgi:hypothetical protein
MTLAEKRDASGAVVLLAVYQYDVFGNRIEKAVDFDGDGPNAAVVTRYVLDGWNNMQARRRSATSTSTSTPNWTARIN